MMHSKLALGVLIAAVAAIGGCDRRCTLIGCGAAFALEFQRASWPAGEYSVTVVADGVTTECTATLPLECDAPAACPEGSEVTLRLEGCAGGTSRIGGIELANGNSPETIAVRVTQDGAVIGEIEVTPEYSQSEPNGAGCGTCEQADDEVLVLK